MLGFEPGSRLRRDLNFMAAEEEKLIRNRRNHLDIPSRTCMASDGSLSVSVSTSPKHGNRDAETVRSSSPKGQCLCSPTMHQGSFRCRLHRSTASAWMKRSKSMPANNPVASLSPKESHGSS